MPEREQWTGKIGRRLIVGRAALEFVEGHAAILVADG
jgi:hypothetical protein